MKRLQIRCKSIKTATLCSEETKVADALRGACTQAAHGERKNMSSSSDDEPQVPIMTVVHARSGADFEAARGGRPTPSITPG